MSSISIPHHKKFDLITCSQELKKSIKKRIEEMRVSLYNLCEQLDFDYKKVRYWMNMRDSATDPQPLMQWQVIHLAESLGIDIRITVVIKPVETAYAIPYDPKKRQRER